MPVNDANCLIELQQLHKGVKRLSICVGMFITGFKLNNDTEYDQRLFHAINYGWREV